MTSERRSDDGVSAYRVPLVEETAAVTTRELVTGRVRVSTSVELVEEMARAVLHSDAVDVVRVPIDRPVEVAPTIRTEGDVTIIPILEEVLVVEKRLMLKEELHVRRTSTAEVVTQPVTLRRQRAEVERFDETARPIDDVTAANVPSEPSTTMP